jgi:hypothetical protein
MPRTPLAILINGPLGIGKSTLGEALGEAIDQCVTLDGDSLAALNPPPADEAEGLRDTIALLVGHHWQRGYDRFVINHYWPSPLDIASLGSTLRGVVPDIDVQCFRLTLPIQENLRRIAARQSVRAIDETELEATYFAEEQAVMNGATGSELGIPFDVSAPPGALVSRMLGMLGLIV